MLAPDARDILLYAGLVFITLGLYLQFAAGVALLTLGIMLFTLGFWASLR